MREATLCYPVVDGRYWVPHLLEGTAFRGDAVFDEDREGLRPSGNRTESDDGEELLEWELETDVRFE